MTESGRRLCTRIGHSISSMFSESVDATATDISASKKSAQTFQVVAPTDTERINFRQGEPNSNESF